MATEKIYLGNIKGPQGSVGPPGATGPAGTPFTYEDFTPAQLDDLAQKIVPDVLAAANICYVSPAVPTSDVGKDGDLYVVIG